MNSVKLSKDFQEDNAIIISYDMTNNTDEAVSPWLAVRMQPFQDGQRMKDIYIEGSQTKKTESVEPGLTMSGIEEAFITSSENEIEIEFTHYMASSSGKVLIISDFPVE